jgi:hypothetical protein
VRGQRISFMLNLNSCCQGCCKKLFSGEDFCVSKKFQKTGFYRKKSLTKTGISGKKREIATWRDGYMISGRRCIVAAALAMVFAPFVYSDILPMSELDGMGSRRIDASSYHIFLHNTRSSSALSSPGIIDLDFGSAELLPCIHSELDDTSRVENPVSLTSGYSSLNLCLTALISLGLCSSVHWVKRVSFGFIPEWYHTGGPFQVGHSHALMPGTLCPAATCCFIQPSYTEDNHLPQHFIKTVNSLWRKSQFTPTTLASRGPPHIS